MNQVPAGIEVPEGQVFMALWVNKRNQQLRFPRSDIEDQPFDLNCKNDPDYVRAYEFVRDKNYKVARNKFMNVDTSKLPQGIDDGRAPVEQPIDRVGMHVSQMQPVQEADENVIRRVEGGSFVDDGALQHTPEPMPDEIPSGSGGPMFIDDPSLETTPARTVPASDGGLLAEQMERAAK